MEPTHWLDDVARSIADGLPVDWEEVGRKAHKQSELEDILRLKTVERITRAHTNLPLATSSKTSDETLLTGPGGRDRDHPVHWGHLLVVEKVGRGAYGDVYRAHDGRLDQTVALKLLRPRVGDQADQSVAVSEARLLAKVRHPNVVSVYGADQIDGRIGFWMEFVLGRTLEEELRDSGPLSPRALVHVAESLGRALTAVHSARLLHRDVKTQNVMRSVDGRILLMDFGAGHEQERNDETRQLAGTPSYLAPEVLQGQPASTKSDLFSLGVLLYRLAAGQYPPKAAKTLAKLRPDLGRPLTQLVYRLIDPSPTRRPSSAAEFLQLLRRARIGPSLAGRMVVFGALSICAALISVYVMGKLKVPDYYSQTELSRSPGPEPNARAESVTSTGDEQVLAIGPATGHWMLCTDRFKHLSGCSMFPGYQAWSLGPRLADWESRAGENWIGPLAGAVSADGRHIAFTSPLVGSVNLFDAAAGSITELLPAAKDRQGVPLSISCSADCGSVLIDRLTVANTHELVLIKSGVAKVVLVRRQPFGGASISHNGRWAAVSVPSPDGTHNIIAIELSSGIGAHMSISEGNSDDTTPVWSLGDDYIFFASNRSNGSGVWKVSLNSSALGSKARLVRNFGSEVLTLIGVSNRGLYVESHLANDALHVGQLSDDGRLNGERRISNPGDGQLVANRWAPDGATLAVLSKARWEEPLLTVYTPDGTIKRIRVPGAVSTSVGWWPDGKSVLVSTYGLNGRRVDRIDVATESLLDTYVFEEPVFEVVVDPSGIAYYSSATEIRSRDLSTGLEARIAEVRDLKTPRSGILRDLRLSPRGDRLGFLEQNDNETLIRSFPLDGRPPEDSLKILGRSTFGGWTYRNALIFSRTVALDSQMAFFQLANSNMPELEVIRKSAETSSDAIREIQLSSPGDRIAWISTSAKPKIWLLRPRGQ